jgi:hypothetical protein
MFGSKIKAYKELVESLQNEITDTKKQLLDALQNNGKLYDAIDKVINTYVPEDDKAKANDIIAAFKTEKKENSNYLKIIAFEISQLYSSNFTSVVESLGKDCLLKKVSVKFVRYTEDDNEMYSISVEGEEEKVDFFEDRLEALY